MHELTGPPAGSDTTPTYYERPLLKMPHWDGWNVVTYLFLGGVTGGLSVIGALATSRRESDRKLKRTLAVTSFVLSAANPAVLTPHLGRPERFFNMLRIVKFKSPMSLGSWCLVFYSSCAGMNALRIFPQFFGFAQSIFGTFLMGYTGVLISATANPLWSSGKRHIPAAFVCSSMSSACALSSLLSTLEGNREVVHRLERLEMIAALGELAVLTHFEQTSGDYGKPLFTGTHGEQLRKYTVRAGILAPLALNLVGAVVPLPQPVNAVRTVVSSVLTLLGGYILRDTVVRAGRASVNNPRAAFVQPT